MSYAKFRKIQTTHNSGRFVVSEGIAPASYLLPHQGLPTWWTDYEDDRFEIVIPKGTILSVVKDSSGDSRLVPANGTASAFIWEDTMTVNTEDTGATPASDSGTGATDSVTVPAKSIPVGCAQYNLYRPFDKGTSQGGGWITFGYVEWPTVAGLNDNVAVGDQVKSDAYGRPVKATPGTDDYLTVGNVIEVEKFATNFDDGLLSYMQLPSDPGALKEVYALTKAGTYQGKLGIRKNLDVANVTGAMRVVLKLT
jgi:hypothetical protein